jgi:hypothetical protein
MSPIDNCLQTEFAKTVVVVSNRKNDQYEMESEMVDEKEGPRRKSGPVGSFRKM